jgi:hypothetical protein
MTNKQLPFWVTAIDSPYSHSSLCTHDTLHQIQARIEAYDQPQGYAAGETRLFHRRQLSAGYPPNRQGSRRKRRRSRTAGWHSWPASCSRRHQGMLLPYTSGNPLLPVQKTSQNAEDVEKFVKQIENLMQVLENSRKRDGVSAGILSKVDRLST